MRLVLVLLLALIANGAATAATMSAADRTHAEETDRFLIAVADAAATTDDVRQWLVAALLYQSVAKAHVDLVPPLHDKAQNKLLTGQADTLVVRAWEKGRDDPVAMWTLALECPGTRESCRPDYALARLMEIDGDNVEARLLYLQYASKLEDPEQARAALTAAAAAKRDSFYWAAQAETYMRAFKRVEVPRSLLGTDKHDATAEAVRFNMAMGVMLARAAPPYGALLTTCRGDTMLTPEIERRNQCVAIGQLMERQADTFVARVVGLRIQQHLLTGTVEGPALAERRRQLDWLQHNYSIIVAANALDAEFVKNWMDDWRKGGELLAMREVLRRQGIELLAPAGWTAEPVEGSPH